MSTLRASRQSGFIPKFFKREDVNQWITTLSDFQPAGGRRSLDIDYDMYGAGEAELAWLDEEVEIHTGDGSAANTGAQLINTIYSKIKEQKFSIGHLKFLLDNGKRQQKISFTYIDQSAFRYKPERFETNFAKILINARVQTEPYLLKKIVSDTIDELEVEKNCRIIARNTAAFQPGYPKPTHRVLNKSI